MAYRAIPDASLLPDSEIALHEDDASPFLSTFKDLRDNPEAIWDGLATTKISTDAIAADSIPGGKLVGNTLNAYNFFKLNDIPYAKLAAGCVAAGSLKYQADECSTSAVTAQSTVTSDDRPWFNRVSGNFIVNKTTFGYAAKVFWGTYSPVVTTSYYIVTFGNNKNSTEKIIYDNTYDETYGLYGGQPVGKMHTELVIPSTIFSPVLTVLLYRLSASPPYDLGNGDIPLFTFVRTDKLGNILGVSCSNAPPWAYSSREHDITPDYTGEDGKPYRHIIKTPCTKQEAMNDMSLFSKYVESFESPEYEEVEITREYKNKNMNNIPNPFLGANKSDNIYLIDPVSKLNDQLWDLKTQGQSINELIYNKRLKLNFDSDLNEKGCITPPGVKAITAILE